MKSKQQMSAFAVHNRKSKLNILKKPETLKIKKKNHKKPTSFSKKSRKDGRQTHEIKLAKNKSSASKITTSIVNHSLNGTEVNKKSSMKSKNKRQNIIGNITVKSSKRKRKITNRKWWNFRKRNDYSSEKQLDSLHGEISCSPEKCFEWFIAPLKEKLFFESMWEKKPLFLQRHNRNYYEYIFSCEELHRILRDNELLYTTNIDITSYKDGKRETLNPEGRAHPASVWQYYNDGCSVRLLNPQTFSRSVWELNSTLQEYFQCSVGANMYLTPPGSQGFAPHYDDIEAFVIQIEGMKRWKIYNPICDAKVLPRYSSHNFNQDEIGKPILDVVLEAGDLLYFPRGTIHQATTSNDVHSLHLTISTYQQNSWADLLEILLKRSLQLAIEEDVEFRKGLPTNYMDYMGLVNSDNESPIRTEFINKVKKLFNKIFDFAPIDAAVDQHSKKYIHECLPPVLSKDEIARSVHENHERWQDGRVVEQIGLQADTEIKLVRKNILRLIAEDDLMMYHSAENARIYKDRPIQSLAVNDICAPSIELLINSFPSYIKVEDLSLSSLTEKIDLASVLYDKGLIITKTKMANGC